MAPLAGNPVGSFPYLAIDAEPAAAAGPHDHSENQAIPAARAVAALRQGEAVGIVPNPCRTGEKLLKVVFKWVADEAGRIGVLDETGGRIEGAGDADPDGVLTSGWDQSGRFGDDPVEGHKNGIVAARRWGRYPPALKDGFVGRQEERLDFGASQVDTDAICGADTCHGRSNESEFFSELHCRHHGF